MTFSCSKQWKHELLNFLYQNKAFHNFPKRGQHSIVKLNIGLEYVLSTIEKNLVSLLNN